MLAESDIDHSESNYVLESGEDEDPHDLNSDRDEEDEEAIDDSSDSDVEVPDATRLHSRTTTYILSNQELRDHTQSGWEVYDSTTHQYPRAQLYSEKGKPAPMVRAARTNAVP